MGRVKLSQRDPNQAVNVIGERVESWAKMTEDQVGSYRISICNVHFTLYFQLASQHGISNWRSEILFELAFRVGMTRRHLKGTSNWHFQMACQFCISLVHFNLAFQIGNPY